MKRFPIQFLQSLLIFGAILVWSCSPNTTLNTNPCVGFGNDCASGQRLVYYEITVTPPLPTNTLDPFVGQIGFTFRSNSGAGTGTVYGWTSTANSYPLSTVTTNCAPHSPDFQHPIIVSIQYSQAYDPIFTPWIGQCHSVDVKAYALDGSLLASWFAPSIGFFVVGYNGGNPADPIWNDCGNNGNIYVNLGTLIPPSCP